MLAKHDPVNELFRNIDLYSHFYSELPKDFVNSSGVIKNLHTIDDSDIAVYAHYGYDRKNNLNFDNLVSGERNEAYGTNNDPIFITVVYRVNPNSDDGGLREKLEEIFQDSKALADAKNKLLIERDKLLQQVSEIESQLNNY